MQKFPGNEDAKQITVEERGRQSYLELDWPILSRNNDLLFSWEVEDTQSGIIKCIEPSNFSSLFVSYGRNDERDERLNEKVVEINHVDAIDGELFQSKGLMIFDKRVHKKIENTRNANVLNI